MPTTQKNRNHLALSRAVDVFSGFKGEGLRHYGPPLPTIPNGTATLTVEGSRYGGALRLEMSGSTEPEGPWYPVASALIEDQDSGQLVCQVPERVSEVQPVKWLRSYYGASSPVDRWAAAHASNTGTPYIPPAFEPHRVTLTTEIKESK